MKTQWEFWLKAGGLTGAVYLIFAYGLPFLLPFLAGYGMAAAIRPIVLWFEKKFHIRRGITAACALTVLLSFLGGCLILLVSAGVRQLAALAGNWNYYVDICNEWLMSVCRGLDRFLGLREGMTFGSLCENVAHAVEEGQGALFSKAVQYSLPTFMKLLDVGIAVFTGILSAFYFSISDAKDWGNSGGFLPRIRERLGCIFGAYFRAQIVIMLITSAVCSLGLFLLGNPYSVLLGILFGILDALPMIGIGLLLLPWCVICGLTGNIKYALGLFVLYMVCYLLREILEPRLIGKRAGISTLQTLASIYIGYRLFGIFGVITGPIAYVFLREGIAYLRQGQNPINE